MPILGLWLTSTQQDFLSGDEIISDTYNLKEIDDVVYEVDCQMVTRGAIQINTGSNARDPNAPTEEGGEDDGEAEAPPEDAPAQVNDVIDGFRLQSMPPFTSKEDFARSLKGMQATSIISVCVIH